MAYNVYERNQTMRMLGNQIMSKMVTDKDIEQIKDVYDAYSKADSKEMLPYEIFMLGFMRGAEMERKKYHRKARNNKE